MISSLRQKKIWLRAAAIAMMVGSLMMPMATAVASGQPRDNDPNSIMWGGCYTMQECLNKIDHGDGHRHTAANIQHIYFNEGRGMSRDNFQHAVDGVVYKNGEVRVNGKVVATGGESIGRDKMAGSYQSGSVWMTSNQGAFLSDSIPAWVNMDGGTFHYFVLKSCGNWGRAKPVPTPTPTPTPTPSPVKSFRCVDLVPTKVSEAEDKATFRFTITPEVKNVTITGYRFTFSGDSSEVVNTTEQTIERALVPGTYTVKGQVKTNAGTSEMNEACSATVTVSKAPTPTPTGHVLGATLPSTGPEAALGGMAGLSAIGLASRAYLRSRKSVVDALRSKGRDDSRSE